MTVRLLVGVLLLWAVLVTGLVPALLLLLGLAGAAAGALAYLGVLVRAMVIDQARIPPRHPPGWPDGKGEPAWRQYFHGQARADLVIVVEYVGRKWLWLALRLSNWITLTFGRPLAFLAIGIVLYAVGRVLWAVAWLFALAAAAGGACVALVHATVVAVLGLLAWVAVGLLRLLDSALLRLRSIRVTCTHCYRRVPYPSYCCPGPSCGLLHTDVRPGRHGVLRRVCACGRRMPTLLLLGSWRLPAVCSHCRGPLTGRSGTASEVVLPLFGGAGAGKTRLLLALVTAMQAGAGEGAVEPADPATERRLHAFRPALSRPTSARATSVGPPAAYSIDVRPDRGQRRLVHLFDAAGERFDTSDRIQELRYLKAARTFLFVVDPFSVTAFWDGLSTAERDRLAAHRRRAASPPEFVFQQAFENLQGMGVPTLKSRLCVAVSKLDLIADTRALDEVGAGDDGIRAWLSQRLGLDNLVRSIDHGFGEARFFATAAVVDGAGRVHPSVAEAAAWALAAEGIRLEAAAGTAASRPSTRAEEAATA